MKKCIYAIIFSLLPFHVGFAKGNIEQGKKLSSTCVACHGNDGNSQTPLWPKIAGQHINYLVLQLSAFKEGKHRNDPSMTGMVANLSPQDMQDVASYYNAQKPTLATASKENLKLGERLYRGGDLKKHIAACIACHGPRGKGNAEAGFPSLSAQHAQYTVKQLNDYKSGKRTTDINGIMRDITKRMDDNDMQAVANYIQGLN